MQFLSKVKTGILAAIGIISGFGAMAQTKEVRYLSGTDNNHTVAWDFFCTKGRKSGSWTKIQVPSCWEQQGFGNYNYGRDYKTNGKNFRFADEQGLYKYSFNVPASWKDKEVYIVFEGAMTDVEVKINDKLAGPIHQGAFYRFKYNITDKLRFGSPNMLEAKVSKMSADASVNNAERLADYWVFGGIYRPVYLEAVPKEFIDYTAIDAKADGSFAAQVVLKGNKTAKTLSTELLDKNGKVVATSATPVTSSDSSVIVHADLKNAKTWTQETPNLYRARFTLKDGSKNLYQTTERFGFRTIEIRKGDGIYLNRVQVKLKGANRHCIWPETGRTLNDSLMLADLLLMKEMNMNAVRCSHYPPDVHFLDLCDSLGLYVLDELAGWQKWYSTAAGEKLVKEMVIKDVNHPSIIFWDNGNEGGTNKELDDDFGFYDFSKRPVIHPHHRPGNVFNGIDCNHYEDYYSTEKILADSNIYMPTEFLHSQDDGGGGAGLADFWELHWKSKRSGGGFLWALVDEGIVRTDMNNIIDVNGVNAPDGLMGPHREKEGSFYAIRDIFSPVKIFWKSLPSDFNGSIPVENRFHFTNLNQCTFKWALVDYRKPQETFIGCTIRKKGTATAPNVAPTANGTLSLSLPSDWKQYDALMLVATDPFGKEIYRWNWNVKSNEQILDGLLNVEGAAASVTETDSFFTLKGGEVSVKLDKKTGMVAALKNEMSDPLSFGSGPIPVQGNATITGAKKLGSDGVEFSYSGGLDYARWKMLGNGWISLEYQYSLKGDYPFTGISFTYPENYVLESKWLGKGPYRVWKNRPQGGVNVWQNSYNNTQTGSAPWTYPEFKGYYSDIVWMELSTVEGKLYVASKDTGLFVRLFDFYGLSGIKPHPDLPVGNLSFLDGIPPIGTKLGLKIDPNASKLGQMSEMNKVDGPVKRTLYFYFGSLKPLDDTKQQFNAPVIDNLF